MTSREREINKRVYQIVKEMPLDERVAVAYGFYDMDGIYGDHFAEFMNFEDGDTSPDATTSINGAFGTNGIYEGLDNFQDFDGDDYATDDEYDNLFTKKSRRKLKKGFKKVTKKIGSGIKKTAGKIKKGIKKVSLKNIGKGLKKVGQTIGKGIKAVGNIIKKGALFVPRQAARGLIALNFRGSATKMNAALRDSKYKKKLESKWKKMGGSWSKLKKVISIGKNKKPKLCGVKCKQKIAKATGKKSGFINADGSVNYGNYQLDPQRLREVVKETIGQYNAEPASTATLVAAGAGVVASLIGVIGGVKLQKKEQEFLKEENEKARKQEDKQLELMATEQGIKKEEAKRQLDIIEKQVKDELDPVNQILNNPDLTAEQKQEAVKQVQEVLEVKEEKKKSKLLLYAGIGLVALIAIGFVLKKK